MRVLLSIGVIFLFLNCEDKQTSKQKNTPVVKDSALIKTTSQKEITSEYPRLTDNNAMEF